VGKRALQNRFVCALPKPSAANSFSTFSIALLRILYPFL
jgi:hypothetical protein